MPAGQPRKFKSGDELLDYWKQFCSEIVKNGYKIAPTYTEFGKWLTDELSETDRRTIYNSLHKYFPEIKKDVETIRADVVAQGTMLGAYQPSMSIFALKNWCGWADKIESQNTHRNTNLNATLTDEQIERILADDDE